MTEPPPRVNFSATANQVSLLSLSLCLCLSVCLSLSLSLSLSLCLSLFLSVFLSVSLYLQHLSFNGVFNSYCVLFIDGDL